jgi:putative lipoprotein
VRASSISIEALLLVVASALCGCGDRQATAGTRLFGLVKFSEAGALPAGARLEVSLDDAGQVSGSGALKSTGAATSIATQTVDAGGQRPPISFTLAVPRNALLPRHRYVLRAEVRSPAGGLLFSTPPDQPPIGNPNTTGRVELTVAPPN